MELSVNLISQVIEGLNIVLDMFPKAKGIIGIEDNKKDAIAKVEALVKGDARISVATLKTKYPQGAERSLIYATTGRSINSSMLPADAGCIVDNVATIVAIKEAVKDGSNDLKYALISAVSLFILVAVCMPYYNY